MKKLITYWKQNVRENYSMALFFSLMLFLANISSLFVFCVIFGISLMAIKNAKYDNYYEEPEAKYTDNYIENHNFPDAGIKLTYLDGMLEQNRITRKQYDKHKPSLQELIKCYENRIKETTEMNTQKIEELKKEQLIIELSGIGD